MNDTPKEVRQKQFEIIMSKTLDQKIKNLFEMTELSRRIIQGRILSANPDLSEIDLKVETFKVFYRFDFDNQTLQKIADQMREYLSRKDSGRPISG